MNNAFALTSRDYPGLVALMLHVCKGKCSCSKLKIVDFKIDISENIFDLMRLQQKVSLAFL